MSSQRFGSQNALLQRVRRYANSSTLFRRTATSDLIGAEGVTPTSGSVVKGYLQASPSDLPVAQSAVSPSPILARSSLPLDIPAAPIRPLPTAPTSAEPTFSSTTEPMVQASPQPADDWGGQWRRMKRIFHGHEAKRTTEGDVQSTPSSETAVQRAIAAAESSSRAGEQPSQQPPLQAASGWPVTIQRSQGSGKPKASATLPPSPTPQQQEQIRAKLSGMTASQPTDSSIEVHLPRRPRPTAPPPTVTPSESVQRKEEAPAIGAASVDQPDMVPTEIGPLPADMWEILGEPVPTARSESGGSDVIARYEDKEGNELTASAQIDAGVGPAGAVQRAIAAVEAPSSPRAEADLRPTLPLSPTEPSGKTTVTPSSPTTPIQRQPKSDAPEAASGHDEMSQSLMEKLGQRPIAPAEPPAIKPAAAVPMGDVQRQPEQLTETSAAMQLGDATPLQRQPKQTTATPTQPEPVSAVELPATAQEAVQRAIAQAEATTEQSVSLPNESGEETAVSPPSIQRQTTPPPTATPANTSMRDQVAAAPKVPPTTQPDVAEANNLPVPTPTVPEVATVQRQTDEPDLPSSEVAPSSSGEVADSSETGEETKIPLASPDTIQRAIATAESSAETTAVIPPRQQSELIKTGEPTGAESPIATSPDVVQRAIDQVEETWATAMEAASEAAPLPVEQPQLETPGASVSDVPSSVEMAELPAEKSASPDTVQRAVAAAESAPIQAEVALLPPIVEDTTDSAFVSDVSAATPEAVQRAIVAAERSAPPDVVQPSATVSPETAVPAKTHIEQQQPGKFVDAPEPAETIQRQPETSIDIATSESDLLAKQEQSEMLDSSPEPVQVDPRQPEAPIQATKSVAPSAPLPVSDAVQRAIAAAEAPPPSVEHVTTMKPTKAAATSPKPTIQRHSQLADSHISPTASQESEQRAGNDAETAVSPPAIAKPATPVASVAIQRQTNDSEMIESDLAGLTAPIRETGDTVPASPVAVQRAIAYAESSTSAEPAKMPDVETTVSGSQVEDLPASVVQPAKQEAGQRAIAAAEASAVSEPKGVLSTTTNAATAVSPTMPQRPLEAMGSPTRLTHEEAAPSPQTTPATVEAIQRAIAAVEAPSVTKGEIGSVTAVIPERKQQKTEKGGVTSQPVSASSPTAIQRAIAAAEAPVTSASPRPIAPETAVLPTATTIENWGQPQITSAGEAKPMSQPVRASQAAVQRAIAAAEAPPRPSPSLEDLSRDLWQIKERPSTTNSNATTTTPNIMRTMAEDILLADNPSAEHDSMTSTIPVVQRMEGDVDVDVSVEKSPTEASSTKAEVDIDKLARQVYAQLKRRLALEWERGRGKR